MGPTLENGAHKFHILELIIPPAWLGWVYILLGPQSHCQGRLGHQRQLSQGAHHLADFVWPALCSAPQQGSGRGPCYPGVEPVPMNRCGPAVLLWLRAPQSSPAGVLPLPLISTKGLGRFLNLSGPYSSSVKWSQSGPPPWLFPAVASGKEPACQMRVRAPQEA